MEKLAPDYQWWDFTFDQSKEDGEAFGFDVREINFSGFYSQGDGACWEGYVDVVRWLELNKADDPNAHILIALIEEQWVDGKLSIISSNSRYSHSHTMNYEGLRDAAPDEDEVLTQGIFSGTNVLHLFNTIGAGYIDEVCVDILQAARNYADEIYKQLRDEYEDLCSEESIAATCDANEYLFDEDGRMV